MVELSHFWGAMNLHGRGLIHQLILLETMNTSMNVHLHKAWGRAAKRMM